MWTLIRDGGVPMLFIMAFGLIGLAASFFFALRAERRSLGFVQGMMQALLFATLAGTASDLGATLHAVSGNWAKLLPTGPLDAAHMLVEGCAESTAPAILGFSFLALTAMLTAVGRRRLDERSGAE